MSHADVVETLYESVAEDFEESRWDIFGREDEYFHVDQESMYFENPKGEMDVWCMELGETPVIYYLEAKTCERHVEDGVEQLERARDFFSEVMGYEFIGEVYLEDRGFQEAVYTR